MVWYAWAIVALYVFGFAVTVASIDKPRKPITHSTAVASIFTYGLYIWAIVSLAT